MEDITDEKKSHLELLFHHVLEYLDTRRDLFLLSLTEKGLSLSSSIISVLVWAFFGAITLLFIGIGAAIWIGSQLNAPALGYFFVAGLFLLLSGLTIAITRNFVRKILTQTIFKLIQENNTSDEADS